ncbi:MAG: four helix bundle protein [Chloroflexi bacterium]|nr:MAG: four helix bundle protein [Chloroflexota bacterium]
MNSSATSRSSTTRPARKASPANYWISPAAWKRCEPKPMKQGFRTRERAMPEQGTRNKEQEGIRPGFWKLRAFQKADDLASEVHGLFRQLPSRDNWFRSQILRAGLSVPTNIAEGCGPGTAADRVRFFEIAARSLNEVEYLLHFAARNDILPHADIESVRAKARSPEGWQRGMVRDEAANTCLKSTMSKPRVHVLAPNDLSLFPVVVPCS